MPLKGEIAKLRREVAALQAAHEAMVSEPCFKVLINHGTHPQGPLLLTAGDEPAAEIQSPAKPAEAGKRRDDHRCGDHCVSVSINFAPRHGDSKGTRGDSAAQVLALPPSAGASAAPDVPDGQPNAPRAPGEAHGPAAGLGRVPARDATIEMRRAPPPGCLPEPGFCGACGCAASRHLSVQSGRPCLWCGFLADRHWETRGPSVTHSRLGADRRFAPCRAYAALYGGPGTEDRCDGDDGRCPCRGFRTTALSTREIEAQLQARIAEQERRIAALAQQIEERRKASEPQPMPQYSHRAPVHVPGINDDGRVPNLQFPIGSCRQSANQEGSDDGIA